MVKGDILTLKYKSLGPLKGGDNHHQTGEQWEILEKNGEPVESTSALHAIDKGLGKRIAGLVNRMDNGIALRTNTRLHELYNTDPLNPTYTATGSKHGRLVNLGMGDSQLEAVIRMLAGDANSIFGGFIGFNHPLDVETAEYINRMFLEGIICPTGIPDDAVEILTNTDTLVSPWNIPAHARRLIYEIPRFTTAQLNALGFDMYQTGTDLVTQQPDGRYDVFQGTLVVGNEHRINPELMRSMQLGWDAITLINSNTMLMALEKSLLAIGNSQGNRYAVSRNMRQNLEETPYFNLGNAEGMERALYDVPFEPEDFEGVISVKDLDASAVISDAFMPKPDALIEATGIDRVHPDFAGGRVVGYEGENIILKRVNYRPDNELYRQRAVPRMVVQPGGCMGDPAATYLSEKYGIPMWFNMPKENWNPVTHKGKAGHRGFSHKWGN